MAPPGKPGVLRVALVPTVHLWEDFLDTIGVSLDEFCETMTGGWLFGYVEALRRADIDTVLVLVSAQVRRTCRRYHGPTGIPIWILPAPAAYRQARQLVPHPRQRRIRRAAGAGPVTGRVLWPLLGAAKELGPYLATPIRELTRVLRREGCGAILCQEYEAARFDVCVALGAYLRIPVFATFQGGNYRWGRAEALVRGRAIRRAAGLVVAAAPEAARIRATYAVTPDRIAGVPNPLDVTMWEGGDGATLRARLGIAVAARVIVWHGRVAIHEKGLDVLLDAWRHLRRASDMPDLHLLMLGAGPDAGAFRARLEDLADPNVHWTARYIHDRAAIREHLRAGDVYVLPSRAEGSPVAPLEAMACGLPVVAADASGIRDILPEGESSGGTVVARGDAHALAAALHRMLTDHDLREHVGTAARRRVSESFSLDAVGKQLAAVLRRQEPARVGAFTGGGAHSRGTVGATRE